MRCRKANVLPLPTGPRQKLVPVADMASCCVVVNVIKAVLCLLGDPQPLRAAALQAFDQAPH
jgi:hypothetical protein